MLLDGVCWDDLGSPWIPKNARSLADGLQCLVHRSSPHLEGLFLSPLKALWKDLRIEKSTCDQLMVWIMIGGASGILWMWHLLNT